MDYIGEHLLPGQLGQFFIVLSLIASLVATFSYFKAASSKQQIDAGYWKKLARYAFITEVISVFTIFGILFYIIHSHLFEYKYAWQHSSRSLEFKYMFACFWEGQEGSFLLWSVWHCVLGLILIKSGKTWESPVMTVISFAQLCLATMIAGIYIFDWKMGSNPFILLRDSGVLDNEPGLHLNLDVNQPLRPDYLASIPDGNDLNVLLQNYWMVIHPPVLFLGFASTIVPFAFAIAGLWKKKLGDWIKPALPWTLFSAAVFGVGIMMGAAWAYESLTFGGYWAWDPVENASLVPWLVLVSGLHTMLIFKNTGYSLRSTFLFVILAFFFVLYSTFLTRSGILGESSVHAFTDLGMNVQLYFFLYVFVWLSAVLAAGDQKNRWITGLSSLGLIGICFVAGLMDASNGSNLEPKAGLFSLLAGIGFLIYHLQTRVPTISKEESGSSREFWMFIGSLVFFLSAIVIIAKTSLPVFNKVVGTKIAAPEDPEMAYNRIQIFVAIIIGLLTGFSQYLKYKSTSKKFFWKKILAPTIAAALLSVLIIALGDINYGAGGPAFLGLIWLAIASSIYAIIANAAYIWLGVKGSLQLSGGSISHLGFGLVLLGILLSSSKKEILSHNTSGIAINFGKDSDQKTGENLTLVKGRKTDMGKYWVTYENERKHPKKDKWFYDIRFEKKDGSEEFTLTPTAFVNAKGREGIQPEPDSRHYLSHDVFTYITALPDPVKNKDTSAFRTTTLKPGDSLFYSRGFILIEEVKQRDNLPQDLFGANGTLHEATLKVYAKTGSIYTTTPNLAFAKGAFLAPPDTVLAENLILQLQKVNPDKSIDLGVKETNTVMEYLALKAYKFPFINVLWAGIIITATGIFISMARRIRLNRNGSREKMQELV
jgi:cytochrome c-type biogenesis protein CcmF